MVASMKIGVMGCGNIFDQYLRACQKYDVLEVAGCADIDMARAKIKADEYGIRAMTVEDMLGDPNVEIIVNLTIPAVHAEVSLAIIDAGKHVYTEKPLGLTREEGRTVLDAAEAKGVRVGCAPDTVLGTGLQTCRKLIDDGEIGVPVAATAFIASRGPESWHPNPDFFYKFGGGPMLDVGPYSLSALVNLLGPVKRVTGSARASFAERIATSQHHNGRRIAVEVPTHVAGVLDFESGAIATMITSFDVWGHNLPRLEIYGSEGTLSAPDPNTFSGPARIMRAGSREFETVPLARSDEGGRGIGVADMADAILNNRPHRVNGEVGYHVLDLMIAFEDASNSGQHVLVESTCARPAALPAEGWS